MYELTANDPNIEQNSNPCNMKPALDKPRDSYFKNQVVLFKQVPNKSS